MSTNNSWRCTMVVSVIHFHYGRCSFGSLPFPYISNVCCADFLYKQWGLFRPLILENKFCGHVNQSVRYVHSCLQLVFLIPTSTNIPRWKSVARFGRRFKKHGLWVQICSEWQELFSLRYPYAIWSKTALLLDPLLINLHPVIGSIIFCQTKPGMPVKQLGLAEN